MSHRGRVLATTSARPDDGGLGALIGQVTASDETAADSKKAAKEMLQLSLNENKNKAELLRKTNIAAFVTKRCAEKGIAFPKKGFIISDEGFIEHDMAFLANTEDRDFEEKLFTALKAVGVPVAHIHRHFEWGKFDLKREFDEMNKMAIEKLRIDVTREVLEGLIDAAAKDKLDTIGARYEQAVTPDQLREVGQLIETETGQPVIGDDVVFETKPGQPRKFAAAERQRLNTDIRHMIIANLLGSQTRSPGGPEIGY